MSRNFEEWLLGFEDSIASWKYTLILIRYIEM